MAKKTPSPVGQRGQDEEEVFVHDTHTGEALEQFTAKVCKGGLAGLIDSYTKLVGQDRLLPSTVCDAHPEKNRFGDIKCFDATRVVLRRPPDDDYINANYVDGFRDPRKFICTQGPLENNTIVDFWRMVWQENSVVVVALTRFGGGKCDFYLPRTSGDVKTFGAVSVISQGTRNVRNTYDATVLQLQNGSVKRRLLHICHYAWPDKSTPSDPTDMLRLVDDINFNYQRLAVDGRAKGTLPSYGPNPIVVHCSAGVGRTGTLVALDVCMRRLDATADIQRPLVDLFDTVVKIRQQRAKAVQRPEQFVFLHLAVIEYALRRRLFHDVSVIDMTNFIGPPTQRF